MKILLVDDDSISRDFLRARIADESPDAEIVEVGDGRAAIRAIRAGGLDLVVTDLLMPGPLNGSDVAEMAQHAGVPTVVVTGHSALAPSWARVVSKDDLADRPATRILPERGPRVRRVSRRWSMRLDAAFVAVPVVP